MQQIYRITSMAKCDFNKVALQNGQTHATRFLTHAYAARFLTCA